MRSPPRRLERTLVLVLAAFIAVDLLLIVQADIEIFNNDIAAARAHHARAKDNKLESYVAWLGQ